MFSFLSIFGYGDAASLVQCAAFGMHDWFESNALYQCELQPDVTVLWSIKLGD